VNKLLFASGDHNNVAVKAGDKRNLSGLLICHPLFLSSPFEEPENLDAMLDELLTERHPHIVAQSRGEYEADKAYIKLTTLKKAAVIALRAIYKVASHTLHVYLRDLIPGARINESHVFTRIRECRNQQLVQVRQTDAAGMTLKHLFSQGHSHLLGEAFCAGFRRSVHHQVDGHSSTHQASGY
jgi:hypothetical protein